MGYALLLLRLLEGGYDVKWPPDGAVDTILLLKCPAQPLSYQLGESIVRVRNSLLIDLVLVAWYRLAALVDHRRRDVNNLPDLLFLRVPHNVLVENYVAVQDI